MDLLIKHGTWIVVPIGLAVSLIYMHVYPKVYPFLVARSLDEQDGRKPSLQADAEKQAPGRTVTVRTRTPVKSHI